MFTQSFLAWIIFVLALFIGGLIVMVIFMRDRDQRLIMNLKCARGVFQPKSSFMNTSEQWFFHVLKEFCAGFKYEIFTQVHMASLIGVSDKAVDYYETLGDLDKSIDFLVVDGENMKPLLAIELNGPDHNRDTRKIRDQFLGRIFKDCAIPYIPIDVVELKDEKKLKDKIFKELSSDLVKH